MENVTESDQLTNYSNEEYMKYFILWCHQRLYDDEYEVTLRVVRNQAARWVQSGFCRRKEFTARICGASAVLTILLQLARHKYNTNTNGCKHKYVLGTSPPFLLFISYERRPYKLYIVYYTMQTRAHAHLWLDHQIYGGVDIQYVLRDLALSKPNYGRWRQWQKGLTAVNLNSHELQWAGL